MTPSFRSSLSEGALLLLPYLVLWMLLYNLEYLLLCHIALLFGYVATSHLIPYDTCLLLVYIAIYPHAEYRLRVVQEYK